LFTDKADQNYRKNLNNNFAQQICFTKVWNFITQPCLNLKGGGQMVGYGNFNFSLLKLTKTASEIRVCVHN